MQAEANASEQMSLLGTNLRRCSRCRQAKPFNRGNQHYCRDCQREYMREWRAQNPEKYQATLARQRENREARNAQARERYWATVDERRKYNREWARANRDSRRATDMRKRYGMEPEEWKPILARGCAICGIREGKLCIDHDHASGRVRDALCGKCNSALGLFDDDPNRVRVALAYLEEHRASQNTSDEGNDNN